MHPLRAVSASVRAAALRRPRPLQQLQLQLVRVFSSRDHRVVNHFAGTLTSGASGHPLRAVDESDGDFDMAFTASRLGFPAYEASDEDDADHDSDTLREESREAATAKAERVLAILRHSMNELDIGRVIHRVSQFATTPRVTHQTRKQFLKAVESRFGPAHTNEYALLVDFLQAKDQLLDESKEQDQELLHEDDASDDLVGFHPELVADPKFIGVVFCYCRLACLNSQKLVRSLDGELPPPRSHAQSKSSLLQVKHDFRRVLESEGLASFVDLMGIKDEPPVGSESVDAEWDEFNLENDRIDFRMLVAQTQELIADMKAELSDETIAKMLVAMLASLKTSKLHRKIFQEMVCNIQAALPERAHARVLTSLVPFLSGNHASYADFESGAASAALQHHRSRHEAILRALLETRMRMGHVLIHDLDAIDPMASVSAKLSPEVREKVITTAWNIVSLLNDREYHVFFSRFLKHKLAWRPGRATFGQTFLDDVRRTLGPRKAELIMPLFEEVFPHLSVETLTICRVRLRHSKKLLKEAAALEAVNDAGAARLQRVWQTDRTVFYRNLPHGATETHVRAALGHIGRVARVVLFADPVHGPPDEIDDDAKPDLAPPVVDKDDDDLEDENEHGATEKRRRDGQSYDDDDDEALYHDDDDEDLDAVDDDDDEQDHGEHDDEDDEDGDSAVVDDDPVVQLLVAKHGFDDSRQVKQAAKIPKRKTPVIASDAKTPFHALVEFDTPSSRDRALQHALQIFGVMMSGFREVRPVFASASDARHALTLQNIPFGTSIATLVDQVNDVLASHGLAVALSSDLPRGVVITSGRLELAFASFPEAAHVVELLGAHVERMKSRREPSREDLLLEVLRQKRRALQEKKVRADERRAKREAKRKDVGKPDDEDDEPDATKKRRAEYDEDEDAYFAAEEAAELLLGDEERALREVPRPFDVTWSHGAREKNKHIYV